MSKVDYKIFNDNKELYNSMLADMAHAQDYIYLETYIFTNDKIGTSFKNILREKAVEGLEIRVLLDDMGSVGPAYFKDLEEAGAKIKFFREFKYSRKIIYENNNRNHRKLLVIDDKISYLGSSNITQSSLKWRELNIRLMHNDVRHLRRPFLDNWHIADKKIFKKKIHVKPIHIGELEIIRDVPSLKYKKIRRKQLEMIKKAKKEVLIEVPYFIPDKTLRTAFRQAINKGVNIILILPYHSDVLVNDLLREKYLGKIHEIGVKIMFYKASILHSKVILADKNHFSFGSANLNFRSLHLEFEINVFGENKKIASDLNEHIQNTLSFCQPFDYEKWKKRSWIQRLIAYVLSLIKYFM
jgi:cardiolipin synthase A/B